MLNSTSLSIAMRVRQWADQLPPDLLAEQVIPGADSVERRRLAALGGIARGLAPNASLTWPSQLTQWCDQGPVAPDELVDSIRESLARGMDPLAAIYERAVTPRHRRQLGTFFTPSVLVEHMLDRAERALHGPPAVIVDPGAGVGAFSVAAAKRWPEARVLAVDVNVVTLGLLGARLACEDLAAHAQLIHQDFLVWLDGVSQGTDGPWLYLGNPPYTRTQALDHETKARAATATGALVTSGHATLSTIFAAVVLRKLRDQDATCLLLPAAWTHTRSARELREALWSVTRRPLELHRWPSTIRAFTGPGVTATVLCVGASRDRAQPYRFARAEVRDSQVHVSAAEERSRCGSCPDPWPGGSGRRVATPPRGTVPLSEIFRSRRGIATGANRFFFVCDATAAGLPESVQRPGILSLRGIDLPNHDLDEAAWRNLRRRGERCVLLDIASADAHNPAVAAYLAAGLRDGIDARHLCAKREPWHSVEPLDPPELLLVPLMTNTVHLVRNTVGALPSNSLYGLYTQPGQDPVGAANVADWLRSSAGLEAMRDHGRRLPGGSLKLEPGDLRTLPVPRALLELATAPERPVKPRRVVAVVA